MVDFILNITWPVFYDYIPVYENMNPIRQYFQKISPGSHFPTEIKGHNSSNIWQNLSLIEIDLHFMIIYLCMKYESNTPMHSKDIALKPFTYRDQGSLL